MPRTTGGWFRIGCPSSLIAKPDIAGAIYRIRKFGVPAKCEPWGASVAGVWKMEAKALIAALGSKDASIARAAGNALAMKPTTDATPALLHRITGELYRSVEHQIMFALITAGDAKTIAAAFRHDHTPALKHRVLTVLNLCFGVASTWMFEV